MEPSITWPDHRAFAFTIFDDPDSQTFEATQAVYSFLKDCGFRTTKGVWPSRPAREPSDHGITCGDNPDYVAWLKQLQSARFEIGFHNATSHTSFREETLAGLDQFAAYFGHFPYSMANHYFCQESVYWGENRVTGMQRHVYNLLTRGKNRGTSHGHEKEHPFFWGDLCKEKIKYVRNFVFDSINTLQKCPFMPYYDPVRPYVNYWFASSEGSNVKAFTRQVAEENQERLEAEGGACIMYVHFGHGFYENGALDSNFRSRMERLARRNGWFVPVSTLLDYLLARKEKTEISDHERASLERKWLMHKARFGTA
ncbi:MAG TPA: hypothetical protein VFZ08_02955 [Terriglobia bacterium]|nr:hypothetical protein [Terriglobia bacterium]